MVPEAINVIKKKFDEGNVPEYVKTIVTDQTDRFEKKYQTKITHEIEDVELHPDTSFDEKVFYNIVNEIYNKKPDDVLLDDHDKRFIDEMNYFVDNDHQNVIIMLYNLVKRFEEDGVVWGVGRGSSVASYILFLIGIHNINPIKYNISPREFYKSFGD